MWKANLDSSLFSNHSTYWTFDDLHPQDTQTQNLKEVEVGYGGYRVLVNSSSSEKGAFYSRTTFFCNKVVHDLHPFRGKKGNPFFQYISASL